MNKSKNETSLTESFVSITLGFLVVVVAGLLIYNYISKARQQTSEENNKQDTWEEKSVDLPSSHTVGENETLWTIAEKYYGTGYNWVLISEENNLVNPDNLPAGTVLQIPEAEAVVTEKDTEEILADSTESTQTDTSKPEEMYTVVKGDNLWKIAVEKYGDGYAWTRIAQANSLVNPDIIHTGNILKLPR